MANIRSAYEYTDGSLCPLDRDTPLVQVNTARKYRVICPTCGLHTRWDLKTRVIIDWEHTCTDIQNFLSGYAFEN